MIKVKKAKLTARAKFLINDFDGDAQSHGWEQDQGTGPDVDRAEKHYLASKKALADYILKLQQKARK